MTKTLSIDDHLNSQEISSPDLNSSQDQKSEVNPENIQLPKDGLKIVHATAGRVRIRAVDVDFQPELEIISHKLKQESWVRETIINDNSSSLILTFDPEAVPLSAALIVLQVWGVSVVETGEKNHPLAAWQSREFWQNQSITLIPLLTGLAVTRGLRISGLATIPVYMIAAELTQWLLISLGKNQTFTREENQKNQEISGIINYKIVHQIPGRVRLHLPLIAENRDYAERLERLLKSQGMVTDVRINIHAASVAIAFSPHANISEDDWQYFLELALQSQPING